MEDRAPRARGHLEAQLGKIELFVKMIKNKNKKIKLKKKKFLHILRSNNATEE